MGQRVRKGEHGLQELFVAVIVGIQELARLDAFQAALNMTEYDWSEQAPGKHGHFCSAGLALMTIFFLTYFDNEPWGHAPCNINCVDLSSHSFALGQRTGHQHGCTAQCVKLTVQPHWTL